MVEIKDRVRGLNPRHGLYPGIAAHLRTIPACTPSRGAKHLAGIAICALVILCLIILPLSSFLCGSGPSKSSVEDAFDIERVYVGSITNQSFRAAWTYPHIPGPGYIMWGPTPETWDTYIGTDIRAEGSIDYSIPTFTYVHLAQTNLGSNENMTGSTTYWFKFVLNGVVYGDDAEMDTNYGYANCTAFGVASPGRPWGITTAPDAEPQDEYIVTGRVLSPGLDIEYRNGIFAMARVNNGTGDSLPLLDVTDFFDEIEYERGYYDFDLGMTRNATDGRSYSISEGTTIELFFENPAYGTCPEGQLASTYPDWEYDTDQSVTMSSPQVMLDHTIIRWPDTIPELTTLGVIGSVISVMVIVSILRRKVKAA